MHSKHVPALLAILTTAACGTSTPTDPTSSPPGSGSYNLVVGAAGGTGGGTSYVGRQVSTNWDRNLDLIYLGPDEVHEPLLSLVMTVGDSISNSSFSHVATAYLTTSKVRVGTGEEIAGRSYTLTGGQIQYTVGVNFIEAEIQLTMERVLFHAEDTPETVHVLGTLRAVSK